MPARTLTKKTKDARTPLSFLGWGAVVLFALGYVGLRLLERYERSAVIDAAEIGDNRRLQMLLRLGVDPNLIVDEKNFQTPMTTAAMNGHWDTVHLLLNAGAKPEVTNYGYSALFFAAKSDNLDALKELLRHGANPNVGNPSSSILASAVDGGDASIVQALLDGGADRNLGTTLYSAINRHRVDMVKVLVQHGADVNARNGGPGSLAYRVAEPWRYVAASNSRARPLSTSRSQGGGRLPRAARPTLFASGAGLVIPANPGYTPLMAAIEAGNREIVQYLIAHGALPNDRYLWPRTSNRLPVTPLRLAKAANRPDLVEILRKAGARE